MSSNDFPLSLVAVAVVCFVAVAFFFSFFSFGLVGAAESANISSRNIYNTKQLLLSYPSDISCKITPLIV